MYWSRNPFIAEILVSFHDDDAFTSESIWLKILKITQQMSDDGIAPFIHSKSVRCTKFDGDINFPTNFSSTDCLSWRGWEGVPIDSDRSTIVCRAVWFSCNYAVFIRDTNLWCAIDSHGTNPKLCCFRLFMRFSFETSTSGMQAVVAALTGMRKTHERIQSTQLWSCETFERLLLCRKVNRFAT